MKALAQLYERLGLSTETGLVKVKGQKKWEEQGPEGITFLSNTIKQLNIIEPDAFYHFNGIPLILFFENPGNEGVRRIHAQSWCFNQAPVIFILKNNNVDVYNAFRYQKNRTLKKLNIREEELEKRFSFWELQSGSTWKWIEETFFKGRIKQHRIDTYLLNNIRTAVTLLEKRGMQVKAAHRLILRLIFTRYLIDRGVIIDETYIAGQPDAKEIRKEQFNRLISDKQRLFAFFSYLKDRFNGNLFEVHEGEEDVDREYLDLLSSLFKGDNLETGERTLFDVYDFGIIPIELISGIYESIIDDKKRKANSAIYTPTFLVDYMLRQTVEEYVQTTPPDQCKVLDPACGSGIFLVEAFRRMVEKERAKGPVPDARLTGLLENNIFGIDKDEAALNVAIFSLYVAVLDFKEPKEIDTLKLPPLLNKTLFKADFFDTGHRFNNVLKNTGITFIIGNPPWKSDKSPLHMQYQSDYPVTDYQVAQSFLIRTKDFSTRETVSALVVTSGVLHRAEKFKSYFLKNFFIDSVLDLSTVRGLIFKGAQHPSAVLFFRFADCSDTRQNHIWYSSLMRNVFLTCFNALVIEKSDIKRIKQSYFMEYPWMGKIALYGSALDLHLLKRLTRLGNTIEEFVAGNQEMFFGNGILEGTPKEKPFTFLEDLPVIEKDAITPFYTSIDEKTRKLTLKDTFLESGRREELFVGEHILLRRRAFFETFLGISYTESSCVFKNSAYGICSKSQPDKLKQLYGIFISDLYTYFQFMVSANWGVFFPEVNQNEYLSFPYVAVEDPNEFSSLVNRFINHYKDHYSKPLRSQEISPPDEIAQINQMVNAAYEIDEIERDLIDYALEVSRYLFQKKRIYSEALRRVTDDDLEQYARIFYRHFGSIYDSQGEYFQVEYFHIGYFVAMKFKIVPERPPEGEEIVKSPETDPDKIMFTALAQKASLYKLTGDLFLNKVIRGFEEDFFYIIKPNQFKSWHRAVAHTDLMEFTYDINKAEIEQMKI